MSEIITTTAQTPIEALLRVEDDNRVSSRSVYEFLNGDFSNYSRWCKNNITENEFAENGVDYWAFVIGDERGFNPKPTTDYRLSIPFAKKLCMLSKTERGEQARDYFIKVEKALQTVAQNLPTLTTNEMVLQLAQSAVEMERRVAAQDEKILTIEQTVHASQEKIDATIKTFAAPSYNTWKGDMDKIINGVVIERGLSSIKFRGILYEELDAVARVSLDIRLSRLRNRMKKQGATYREWHSVTKLDVISKDKQLRQIFEGIVKRHQVTNEA